MIIVLHDTYSGKKMGVDSHRIVTFIENKVTVDGEEKVATVVAIDTYPEKPVCVKETFDEIAEMMGYKPRRDADDGK